MRNKLFDFRWIRDGLFWIAVALLAFIGLVIVGSLRVERGYERAQARHAEVRR